MGLKVAMCTPYGPHLDHPEVITRIMDVKRSRPFDTFYDVNISMHIVSLARTKLVETALAQGVDVVWFVDSDVLLPADAGIILDHVMNDRSPVVSGLYVHRHPPHLPQVYVRATVHANGDHPYLPVINIPNDPTFVDATGAGCLAVRADVFGLVAAEHRMYQAELSKRLAKLAPLGATARALHYALSLTPWFEFLGRVGEDFYFFEQLDRIGIRPLLLPMVKCYHIGQQPFGFEHFESAKRAGVVQDLHWEHLAGGN